MICGSLVGNQQNEQTAKPKRKNLNVQLGLVVGTATATRKHASLAGAKMLIVQALQVDGRTPDGEPVIAVDTLGAGRGETVLMTSDGRFTRDLLSSKSTPVRWSVIGIPNS